ncbi:MAG: geranylgeranyl reductase family protein [Candidatus Lokiarchaeota archaeon]|nr:geranylgeranyl reductase family protein [Candidatus Lokiarchaeota archaeon]
MNISEEKLPCTCDVCIIGANIAGSYLAYLLAQKGIDIIVVEKNRETGLPLRCAGIISQKLASIIDLDRKIVLNRVQTAQIVAPNNLKLELRGKERPFIVDRVKLDKSFYEKAKNLGVTFLFRERFLTYRKKKSDSLEIRTSKRKIYCQIIVGCDGPHSRVAKLNGVRQKLITGMQIRVRYKWPKNFVKMIFNPKWKELFGWIIPEGNGICRIGMGAYNNPGKNFREFLVNLSIKKPDIIDHQGGMIPYGYIRHIAFERTLLLGDAACMVKATTGGGVIMLLSSAGYAANSIQKSLNARDFSKKFLIRHYERKVKKKIGLDLKIHYLIRFLLTQMSVDDLNQLFRLIKNNKNIQNIIENYADMDFPKSIIIKILLNRDFILYLFKMIVKNLKILPDIAKILIGNYRPK